MTSIHRVFNTNVLLVFIVSTLWYSSSLAFTLNKSLSYQHKVLAGTVSTSTSTTSLSASSSDDDTNVDVTATITPPDMGNVGFILLAGGTGSRMKASMPKQYLPLYGIPVLHHSLDLFLNRLPDYCNENNVPAPKHVVLVMDPTYQTEYQSIIDKYPEGQLSFANPGKERQGSVENGLKQLIKVSDGSCQFAAIHDSARPLVTINEICNVIRDGLDHGAAVLGVPCKATIKESEDGSFVLRTIPRSRLWEVHTPQVVNIDMLLKGFDKVTKENLEVTDDVSIIETLNEPVKLTKGEYTNLKITTPEDMDVAKAILDDRQYTPMNMF